MMLTIYSRQGFLMDVWFVIGTFEEFQLEIEKMLWEMQKQQ